MAKSKIGNSPLDGLTGKSTPKKKRAAGTKKKEKRDPGRPPSGIKRTRRTLYLPVVLNDRLRDLSHEQGTSASDTIARMLLEYFEKHTVGTRPKQLSLQYRIAKIESQTRG